MEQFKNLITEQELNEGLPKLDTKKLAKLMAKDFKGYGGPGGSRDLDEYLRTYINIALMSAKAEFDKTSEADKIYTMWAKDHGQEDIEAELEYYKNEFNLIVNDLEVNTVN